MDAPDSATEIYVTDPSFANLKRLTNTNPQLAEVQQGETEVITWKSSDGVEVEGVLLKPVGFESGKRYPTLVVAHGGPAGAYVNGFRLGGLEGGQVWAGKGWAVFYPNPRGSSNYGQKTLAANVNDWGGGDFKDIMTGVDALVARGIADPDKLAHIGWSYGGYMTAWTITQTTPLQGGDGRRRPHQHVEHVRHQRHSERADRLLRRHPEQADAAALSRSLGDDAHRQGDDADADPARRQRRARADGPGLRAVPGTEGSRQGDGAGVLSARGPRLHRVLPPKRSHAADL